MVVDTSIILTVLFAEPHAEWAAEHLDRNADDLRMSTVNLTEALIRIRDQQPQLADELEDRVLASGIRFVPVDLTQARIAAGARLRFPVNLGDCFAYALAVVERCPIITTDRSFERLDCAVVLP